MNVKYHSAIIPSIELYENNLGIKLTSSKARGIALKLRHGGKSRHTKKKIDNRGRRFWNASTIHDRPRSAQNRSRFGHWEADTVRGKNGKVALITLVDQKSRLLLAQRVEKVNSKQVCQGLIGLLKTISPNKVLSITAILSANSSSCLTSTTVNLIFSTLAASNT